MVEDKDLLAKVRNPETASYGFNLLVRAYQQRVYWLVRKMVIDHDDANDLTQEVFIKVHKYIPGFREDSQLYCHQRMPYFFEQKAETLLFTDRRCQQRVNPKNRNLP
jgi:hypothetical protein